MKKGISLDHAPRSRKLIIIPRIISLLLLICILGCVGYDYLNDERYTMPDVSDGPYILLSDLDIEGKRTTNSVNGEGSMVKANQSMLADHWDTQEYVDVINGSYSSEGWLYQDVYILKNEDMVDRFVEVLMIDSVFAQSTEDYTRIEIPGLDQAWVTERLECIGNVKKCAVGKHPKSEKLGSTGQAACCARIHSRYFTGGNPSGLRV